MNTTNIATITILCLLVLLPYLAIMSIIAIFSYNAKLKSAISDFKNYATARQDGSNSNLPMSLRIYIVCMLLLTIFMICLIIISIGYYLRAPWILDILDSSLLGKIIVGAFVIATIITILVSLLYDRLFRKRE